ncbi:MAG: DUF2268 domain-containing putative Zn-dependent protease [Flavobacteriales bacterium]
MKSIYSKLIPLLMLVLFSCEENPLNVDVKSPETPVHIKRYDVEVFKFNRSNVEKEKYNLAKNYSLFFEVDEKDPRSVMYLLEYVELPLNKELHDEVQKKYKDLSLLESDLTKSFSYYQYYFPKEKRPEVYSYISSLDFEHPVDWIDSLHTVVIALDMYLGSGFKPYYMTPLNLFQYQTYKLQEKFIPVDIFKAAARAKYENLEYEGNTMIEKMISEGKVQYFLNAMMPFAEDSTRLKYTSKQMEWAKNSELGLWRFFVDKKLLHSEDYVAYKKYIEDGPFTFSEEADSPGRIGEYIGFKIVKSYMENNQVSLDELMKDKNLLKIFQKSKYKPE